ncbi:putative ferredoxin-like protein YfhL [Vibrio aerogenes CECT 7868]|uniref:Putative ferredoxin-like protein YfhL n=1 Tax=Vibrio aerogenes CECT 7868 TaxID=1216006 RepID=A0A1M5WYJ1_9VIBR|nr:4Fe-4S binding protein [Vibrio aerogenes]SHH91983.1 putative ferredoxin-like protein YfhL [Vibrio aerogenes CECT 7868]
MKYAITDKCVGCHACSLVCPSQAVYQDCDNDNQFHIHSKRCTGCLGKFDTPQCATICPVEEAIIDSHARPVNPAGSLTGIVREMR